MPIVTRQSNREFKFRHGKQHVCWESKLADIMEVYLISYVLMNAQYDSAVS